jgi:hypothetical protein
LLYKGLRRISYPLALCYMRLPGPRTIHRYEPSSMTKNMARARANSVYSAPVVGALIRVMTTMVINRARAIKPAIITVLTISALSIAAFSVWLGQAAYEYPRTGWML